MTLAKGLTAMVVEDHEFQRRTLIKTLNKLCFDEIYQAGHGIEGLAILRDGHNIDLIICDLDMPEMDGIEFMRHLSDLRHQASVIISSAKEHNLVSSVEKMARAYGVRLLGIIEKPLNREEIIKLITKHRSLVPHTMSSKKHEFTLEEILDGLTHDQFVPYYQPKVAFESGRICGAEALARWQHPRIGVIGPGAFVPTLEESGNIDMLTMVMLQKASQACKKWSDQGQSLTISINLSLAGLDDPSVVGSITSVTDSVGLDSRNVILEITESAAMTDSATALEVLARLRMKGFGLSIDDYGTGFSSLKQLTRVPFTELKIDQSFVNGCSREPSLQTIIESSIDLAKGLNLTSVAEGIEDQADWDLLESMGCEVAQGYMISKPISELDFMELVRLDKFDSGI